jgi:hypothetical protein
MSIKMKLSDEEVFEWFEHLESQKISNKSAVLYARNNNLLIVDFRNYSIRINWLKYTQPEVFYPYMHYATVYDGLPKNERSVIGFIDKYNLDYNHFSQACTHLQYDKAIKREAIKRGIELPVTFPETYFDADLFFNDEKNMEEFKNMSVNSIKLTDPEVYFWYEHCTEQRRSGMGKAAYCTKHKLNVVTYHNIEFRIHWKKFREPAYYKKMIFLLKKYKLLQHVNLKEFCAQNNIDHMHFSQVTSHFNYLRAIERELLKRNKDVSNLYPDDPTPEEMLYEPKQSSDKIITRKPKKQKKEPYPLINRKKYYQEEPEEIEYDEKYVEPPIKEAPVINNGHEVKKLVAAEASNEIEFRIADGVRVFVSPNIESIKMMKIFDMLKAL